MEPYTVPAWHLCVLHWSRDLFLRTALEHERTEPRPEGIGRQLALDLSVRHHRDAAGLFRDDDRDRIVLLGETNRRTMARPELFAQFRVDGERKKTGRGRHPVVLHDHGAVVERRRRLEN